MMAHSFTCINFGPSLSSCHCGHCMGLHSLLREQEFGGWGWPCSASSICTAVICSNSEGGGGGGGVEYVSKPV